MLSEASLPDARCTRRVRQARNRSAPAGERGRQLTREECGAGLLPKKEFVATRRSAGASADWSGLMLDDHVPDRAEKGIRALERTGAASSEMDAPVPTRGRLRGVNGECSGRHTVVRTPHRRPRDLPLTAARGAPGRQSGVPVTGAAARSRAVPDRHTALIPESWTLKRSFRPGACRPGGQGKDEPGGEGRTRSEGPRPEPPGEWEGRYGPC